MTSAYSINLNFNNTIPIKTDFTFKQGDKGITLNLATTGLDTTGTTAKIVFKRSNGTSVEADLVGAGPTYSYTILGNEFEIPGVVVADLKLYNGDTQRVSTASFIFLVTGDTMDGVGGGTGGYSDQLEQLSQEFAETLQEYQDAFGDVGAINPRGEYSALEEYTALDLVSYNGNSYLCREGCTGIAPTNTTYWQVFASGGGGVDYNDVSNKPSINSVTLSGNKTTADLGLFSGDYDDLENKPTIPSDFDDLADVDMAGVTDGQVPTWDAMAGKYKPGTPAGGGGGTNPNLLINGWFTVNQRGVTSGSMQFKKYGLDRWMWLYMNHTGLYSLSSSGLTINPSASNDWAGITEVLESDVTARLNGETITASLMYSDGTIASGTLVRDSSQTQIFFGTATSGDVQMTIDDVDGVRVKVYGTSKTIKAVKLEKGAYSTLHLDTAPDYTTELLKCQRYFVRLGKDQVIMGFGVADSTTRSQLIVKLPVPTRDYGTVSYAGSWGYQEAGITKTVGTITRYNLGSLDFADLLITSSNLTAGAAGLFYASTAGSYLDIDAEL